MDLRDLRYFEAIAEIGHLGQAAATVNRTQPALSKCIDRLEAELDTVLFRREGRRLQLTPVGQVLLSRSKELAQAMQDTVREVGDFSRGVMGSVRVGCAATVAEHLLPQVCGMLLLEAPNVTVELSVGMNDMLRQALRSGALDLVIAPLRKSDAEFTLYPLIDDEVVVVARPGHPLNRPGIVMADLCKYNWALATPRVATHRWLHNAFQKQKLPPPKVQIGSSSILLLPRLIASTDLLSFVSRQNLAPGQIGALLRELPLPDTTMRRTFGILNRTNSYLSPAAHCLMDILKKNGTVLFDPDAPLATS
jgi:DNA-binding transcriptional LysR family regulator